MKIESRVLDYTAFTEALQELASKPDDCVYGYIKNDSGKFIVARKISDGSEKDCESNLEIVTYKIVKFIVDNRIWPNHINIYKKINANLGFNAKSELMDEIIQHCLFEMEEMKKTAAQEGWELDDSSEEKLVNSYYYGKAKRFFETFFDSPRLSSFNDRLLRQSSFTGNWKYGYIFERLSHEQLLELAKCFLTHIPKNRDKISSTSTVLQDFIFLGLNSSELFKIWNFNKDELFELALYDAQANLKQFSSRIGDYGIKEESQLFAIAKMMSGKPSIDVYCRDSFNFSDCIKDFVEAGLRDQEMLLELALDESIHNAYSVGRRIKNFGITSEDKLIKIAQIIAEKGRLSENIKDFIDAGFKNQEQLYKLALIEISAVQNPFSAVFHLKDYGFVSEDKLIGVTRKISEKMQLSGLVKDILNAGLKDPDKLYEFARIILDKENSEGLVKCIGKFINYGITEDQTFEIAKIALQKEPNKESPWLIFYENLIHRTQNEKDLETFDFVKTIDKLKQLGLAHWKEGFHLESELAMIAKNSNTYAKKAQLAWIIMFMYDYQNQIPSQTHHLQIKPLIADLLTYPDPTMRQHLTPLIYRLNTPEHLKNWTGLKENLEKTTTAKKKNYTLLPHLLLVPLCSADAATCQNVIQRFFSCPLSERGDYQKTWISFLYHLTLDAKFTASDKIHLLQMLFNDKFFNLDSLKIEIQSEQKVKTASTDGAAGLRNAYFVKILETMQLIEDLLIFEQHSRLKICTDFASISSIMQQLFIKEFGAKIENFEDHYRNTFGIFRHKNAIMTYLGRLRTLAPPVRGLAINLLNAFVVEVLNGTFKESRYDKSKSEHLQALFGKNEELEKKWKQGEKLSANQLVEEEISQKGHELPKKSDSKADILTLFKTALITNRHLGDHFEREYPYLNRCLMDLQQRTIEQDKLKKELIDQKNSKNKDKGLLSKLRLQASCIELLDPKAGKEKIRGILTNIKELDVLVGSEFKNDVEVLLNSIQNPIEAKEGLIVVDSDDPNDLLLMGTEVGSCQRVNGDPRYNIGLLGSLLDGKIRIVLVKDASEKIIGRVLLRMLWDEQLKKAVLYQEPSYPTTIGAGTNQLLHLMCRRRARLLGVALVGKNYEQNIYPNPLKSLSGPGFEYVDALGPPARTSVYVIKNASLLQLEYQK